MDMRITPIAIADPPLLNCAGLHAPYALRTIIELVSEDGITGASETHGGERLLAQFEHVRPSVIGRNVWDLARLSQAIEERLVPSTDPGAVPVVMPRESVSVVASRIFGAIEVAALDLIGKATGVPVCELLGGRVRDEVHFSAYLFYKLAGGGGTGDDVREDHWGVATDPDGIVAQAKAMIDAYGFGSIKLKGGVYPPRQEIEAILALRDGLGPDTPLRIDPNGAWTPATSLEVGKALNGVLEYFEDPAPTMAGMAEVRRGLLADADGNPMPLATNMVVTAFDEIAEGVRTDAVQVILADHHYWGGLRAITHLGTIAQAHGLGLSMHSNSHLGLSLLAMVHVAAATPHLTYASDTHYPWQSAEDEILVGGRVEISGGAIQVPTAPGLGAEIDQDALAHGRERYDRCGYRVRDDAAEMRKHVDPNWEYLMPRW
jgi:glucarate dehydratase